MGIFLVPVKLGGSGGAWEACDGASDITGVPIKLGGAWEVSASAGGVSGGKTVALLVSAC